MPVTTAHRQYDAFADDWRTLRDAFTGSAAIRKGATRYLPRPSGMHGSVQRDKAWRAYLDRPEWFNATRRTIDGLTGAVFRKEPTLQGLEAFDHFLHQNITGTGVDVLSFLSMTFRETLLLGRYGMLLDLAATASEQPQPSWIGFCAENILNWRFEHGESGDAPRLTLVVLREDIEVLDEDHRVVVQRGDLTHLLHFDVKEQVQYRVLSLDEMGFYRVDMWRERQRGENDPVEFEHVETLFPTRRGARLPFIPFVFVGVHDIEPHVEPSPVWDLVRINLRHWRHSADYEHGLHYTALPTPWITGHDPEHDIADKEGVTPAQIVLGSGEAIVLRESDAAIGLLTLSDSEFGALKQALENDKREMAVLGARLLEERPDIEETATAVRLRQTGDESILRALAMTVSRAATLVARWHAWWVGLASDPQDSKIRIALNTDFLSLRLSPQDILALMQLQQAGAISSETLYHNLVQGEVAQEGVSFEEEQARIAATPPLTLRLDLDEPDEQKEG